MGGSKETSTQKTEYDPAYMARLNANYDRTLGIADLPFQPYTGERNAPFTETQLLGQQGLLAAARDPTGTNNINSAASSIGGLLNYKPNTITAPMISAGQLSATDLAPYMNPYTNDVIDQTITQQQHARDQQGVADNATATAAHAFGGTRQAVQRALTSEGYDRNTGNLIAGLNQANYSQAQQAALQDIGNRFNADQFNATGAYNASVANVANDLSGANLRLNAGNSLANLSDAQLRDALTRAGVIEGVGAEQQALQQAQDDAAYQEFLRQLSYPYETQNLLNSSLGMYPVQATTTNTTTKSPGAMGILGGILGGAQTAGALGWQPFSDERTKENIRTESYDHKGRRWVTFNYKWDDPAEKRRGVIAQEILSTDPDAVSVDPATGFYRVDYSKLEAA
jgi:hypothetical protein